MSGKQDVNEMSGIASGAAENLVGANSTSAEAVALASSEELTEEARLAFDTPLRISDVAKRMTRQEFMTAKELWELRSKMKRLTTGCKALDELLGGGIETQAITEFWGEYASGKSQLCMRLSTTVQRPGGEGGLSGKALFIDTEGTFSPQRVYQISDGNGYDPEETLENIIYARCYNSDHQQLIVDQAFKLCQEENIKLVVVDSITSHWRADYIGRENLSERQQKLNSHLHKLLRLSEALNLAVVVTNQVQANPSAFFGNPNRPAGGHVVAHACTHRIELRKGRGSIRIARVADSPYLPEDEAQFLITEKGIEDVKAQEGGK
ncbi:MAG: DNA repair and recombination protein RadA [Candidatus Bathyarchaeia archaeon]